MTTTDQATAAADGVVNGVVVEALRASRAAMTAAPAAARFTWRVRNRWADGTHSTSTVHDFHGAGGEQAHRREIVLEADHPELFHAGDHGAAPVEHVLHALAACVTGGIATVAAHRGIHLETITSTVEGDMDLRGVLGIDDGVRNGYAGVRITLHLEGDADEEQLRRLVDQSVRRSAVHDVLTGRTPVEIRVDV